MEANIKAAVAAGINTYGRVDNIETKSEFLTKVEHVFDTDGKYIDKLALLDEAFDDYPLFDELREVYVDLLLMNFFSIDIQKLEEDYLESEEWEKIEDETIDRGTELLNIFLYLRECKDDEIDPDLDDYLKEFLLVDEDEFQDEHEIYEDIIANQILVESTYAEIAKTAKTINPSSEVYELFYAIISFFSEINPKDAQFEEYESHSENKAFDAALYQIITNFYKG
ncbi:MULTISPECIES: hypothetical protein [Sphingobacterium]|jgi:hypothetical protein|uniref:hypothetical protein n=1 Tax=Sphingobacterium TaxID=28453 RepID=UPI00038A3A40|nr:MULTISPECIES: hypothetical protein [Sphingobacterium]KKX48520.1 hypothetical protein L950_0220735 [Sphingobacterium sp. IITKGP-BTPF85]MBB2952112.1 hypothetical protein [Sphingobacterium sp. JUb56]MCS3553881.1 hypothetical protein [Sphingobacterium sp. JUb21]MCW2260569.1 hypothetical protein [Sphingobacterium kitahiroshimense]NJI75923.1 hypothetical protein [Sphingobacterium sp. B16(2022)]